LAVLLRIGFAGADPRSKLIEFGIGDFGLAKGGHGILALSHALLDDIARERPPEDDRPDIGPVAIAARLGVNGFGRTISKRLAQLLSSPDFATDDTTERKQPYRKSHLKFPN
jgi:hypothetical protein